MGSKAMTACVAAVAEKGKAIVAMADRRISGGSIEGDVRMPKMRILHFGWWVMFAGDTTLADTAIRRIRKDLERHRRAPSLDAVMGIAQSVHAMLRRETAERRFLVTRMLTEKLWARRPKSLAPLDPRLVEKIDAELGAYTFDLDLMLCGFDQHQGTIFSIQDVYDDDGKVEPSSLFRHTMEGYGAIGGGEDVALSHLVFRRPTTVDDCEVVAYEVFEAMAYTEVVAGVGPDYDAWVMWEGKQPRKLEKVAMDLLEGAFDKGTRLPMRPRPEWKEDPEWEGVKGFKRDWDKQLRPYLLPLPTSSSPSARGRRVSQSPSGGKR